MASAMSDFADISELPVEKVFSSLRREDQENQKKTLAELLEHPDVKLRSRMFSEWKGTMSDEEKKDHLAHAKKRMQRRL